MNLPPQLDLSRHPRLPSTSEQPFGFRLTAVPQQHIAITTPITSSKPPMTTAMLPNPVIKSPVRDTHSHRAGEHLSS